MSRPTRLAILVAVAAVAIGIAALRQSGWQPHWTASRVVHPVGTSPTPARIVDDVYSVVGTVYIDGRMISAARPTPSEFDFLRRLNADGIVVKAVRPPPDGRSTFGSSVVHQLDLEPAWHLYDLSSIGGPLFFPVGRWDQRRPPTRIGWSSRA